MDIIKRSEAKIKGLTKYFTGKPCPKGHISERYVSSFTCTECLKDSKNRYAKRGVIKCINECSWEGVRFKDASHKKLIFYEGKSCTKCGNTKRYTNNSECVHCSSERAKSEDYKNRIKEYYSIPKNKEKRKKRCAKYIAKYSSEVLKVVKSEYNNNSASYTTYHKALTIEEDPKLLGSDTLEVRCSYCRNYFVPKHMHVNKRVQCLKGNYQGESRLYCSQDCKSSCFIFGKHSNKPIIDNIRPLQNEWKRLYKEYRRSLSMYGVLYCEKCGVPEEKGLIAHHIDPVVNNPIESVDIDNCMLLCNACHIEVHKKIGCTVSELRCK